MEKNITLQQRSIQMLNTGTIASGSISSSTIASGGIVGIIKKAATAPVEWLRQYYSGVLEREVSTSETLRYVHAQLSFVMAVFPSYDSLLVHAAVALWAASALLGCRRK